MKRHTLITLMSVALLLSGCFSQTSIKPSAGYSMHDDEAIVFMGVKQNYKVSIYHGENIENGMWKLPGMSKIDADTFPIDGYITIKLKPSKGDSSYGFGNIKQDGLSGKTFVLCTDNYTPTFQAKPGVALYIGDFELSENGRSLILNHSTNEHLAKEYLSESFPALANRYELGTVEFRKVEHRHCYGEGVFIPIFI